MTILSIAFIVLGIWQFAMNSASAATLSMFGGSIFLLSVVTILTTASYIAVGVFGLKAKRHLTKKALYISILLSFVMTIILSSVRNISGTSVAVIIGMGLFLMLMTRRHIKKSIKELQDMSLLMTNTKQ